MRDIENKEPLYGCDMENGNCKKEEGKKEKR